MPLVLRSIHRAQVDRFIRYGSVSAISTLTTLTILGVLVGVFGLSAVWANIVATAVGTIPSFELNRRWVWSQRGARSVIRQVVPYAALSFSGLIVSSIAVHLASDATGGSARLLHTGAVEAANVGAYGALWLFQFVLCDRVLFKPRTDTNPDAAASGIGQADGRSASIGHPVHQHAAQFPAGTDAEFRKHLAEVPFNCARTDEELRADL
jgi:putative flippase GtrA